MDKETLIRLATPLSIVLLTISIFYNASQLRGTKDNPFYIGCSNSTFSYFCGRS